MSKIIKFKNTLPEEALKTYVASSYASGGSTVPIKNPNGFQASWAIQVGETGGEESEILVLGTAAPSGTTLTTTANTLYAHATDTPIYATKYDQIVVKRSVSGTTGAATAVATVSITPDSLWTQYDDLTGLDVYAYRAAFRNSVSGTTTGDSAWLTVSGYSFYSLAKLRGRMKEKLHSAGYIKSDDYIDDWANEWLEQMTNTATDVNQDYLLGSADFAYGTDGLATITATDYKDVRRVWYTTDGNDYFSAVKDRDRRFRAE